jgi:hypothetical protein
MPIRGSCHCGRIAFTFDAAPTEAIECNCSICRMRGSVLTAMDPGEFSLATPREDIATYTFNTHNIQHRFCPVCGVAPFAEGTHPNGGAMVVVNLRCTEVDLDSVIRMPFDGASL